MTYERFDVDPIDAMAKAAKTYPGGLSALAGRILMAIKTLQNKLSPAVETHLLSVTDFSDITDKLAEVKSPLAFLPLQALCWRHNHLAIPLPDHSDVEDDELLSMVVAIFGEEGRLAEDIRGALADDKRISDRELKKIEVDIKRVMEYLVSLRDRVRTKNQADFHGHQ